MNRILVTGGGSGIGAATAQHLARGGAAVTVCGRRAAPLLETARADAAHAHPIQTAVVDVSDEAAVVELFRTREFEGVVCAAGIILLENVFDMSTAGFQTVMNANLMGTYLVCREAMRQMRARGVRGNLVTISSLAGIRGMQVRFPGSFAYVTSKHAVAGLTEALAVDGRPHGIRINCISPGRVDTAIARQFGGIPEIKPLQIAALIESLLDRTRTGAMSGSNIEVYSHD